MANDQTPATGEAGSSAPTPSVICRPPQRSLRDNGRPETSIEVIAIADRLDAEDAHSSEPAR